MSKKPVRVYLDSSDFSELSKSTFEMESLKLELLRLREIGKAEFGYSYWHVMELIRDGPEEARENRRQRAEILKLFCGKNCFPYPTDYIDGYRYPNNGFWMPRIVEKTLTSRNLENAMREMVLEKKDLSRNLRRKLGKSSNLKRLILESGAISEGLDSLQTALPLSPEILENRYIERFLEGRISARSLDHELQKWVKDPLYFFGFWYKFSGKENHLENMAKKPYDNMKSAIDELMERSDTLKRATEEAKKAHRAYQKTYYKSDGTIRNSIPHPKEFSVENPCLEFEEINFEEKFKGIGYINCYMRSLISGEAKLQKSDIGDLMHIYQHQDTDILRLDRKMSRIFSSCQYIDSKKIVSRLTDLPNRIHELFAEKARQKPPVVQAR